jgi:hypothetical protein
MPRDRSASFDWRSIRRRLIFLSLIAAFALMAWAINRYVPNQHLPWRPLDPDAPIGTATKGQLLRLAVSPSDVCMSMARDVPTFVSLPSEPKEAKAPCGWTVARIVYGTSTASLAPGEANMQCPLSVATYIWIKAVDQLAQDRFGQGLSKVHHMGSFSCRRQRGNGSGRWSEHAFANAWDIAAFELNDGRLIRVVTGWDGDDRQDKRFLRDARDAACRVFNVTLSPDYNAAHHDHFHVDMGPASVCR